MNNFSFSLKEILHFFLILNFLCVFVRAIGPCPPEEGIQPCTCTNAPYPVLQCSNIPNEDILRNVFAHSSGYKYREVHLAYASLKYLPKELFAHTEVSELYLTNSTLNFLFDSPPENMQSLYKLHLENTKVVEISHWELLEHLTHLKHLVIYYNFVERIDSSIGQYISKEISQIILYGTGTKYITPGALVDLPNLDRLSVDACKLTEISRDIFPKPSNIRHVYFNNNDLKTIPADMFTDMPRLMTVGLRDNALITIPETAFGNNIGQLQYLMLDGNPIKCTCNLRWLITNKPAVLGGSCATPLRINGKPLQELNEKDLKC